MGGSVVVVLVVGVPLTFPFFSQGEFSVKNFFRHSFGNIYAIWHSFNNCDRFS